MGKVELLPEINQQTISRLVDIWESAVRSTHTFLSEADIVSIKPAVY